MNSTLMDRRNVLGGGAAAALWYVFAAGELRAADSSGRPLPEGDAYAPWRLWRDPSLRGTPLALVAAGILAANPHDTQPWRFAVSADRIEIFADVSRNLGAMDALLREMHLGLGCAIENMAIAAGPNGYSARLETSPGGLVGLAERGKPIHAATLFLTKLDAPTSHPNFDAIPQRHTNRYAYDPERTPPSAWGDFARDMGKNDDVAVLLFDAGPQRAIFDANVLEATQAIVDDEVMIADSDRWFRGSSREIDLHRDGPTLDAAGLSLTTLWLARLFSVSAQRTHEAWLDQTRRVQIKTAPLVGLIAVRDRYDRPSALAAGRVWQRLHLDATLRGIAMQPLNQPIEMIDRDLQIGRPPVWAERLARLTGPDWQATFSFRAGFSSSTASASPRRRLADVLDG